MRRRPRTASAVGVAAGLCLTLCAAAGSIDDDYAAWDEAQARRAAATDKPLDDAYARWEDEQADLADVDLRRRTHADAAVKEQLELNSEYARWEADEAARAHDELVRKAKDAAAAGEKLRAAQEAEAKAKADVAAAEEAQRAAAEAKAQQAEDERVAAEQDKAKADDAAARAKEKATQEAQRKQEAEQAAIAARYAAQQQAQAKQVEVTAVAEKTVYATRDVNVRSGPGTGYSVVASLARGDAVKVNGAAGGFWRTTAGAFVTQTYTSDSKPADDPAPAAPPAASGTAVAESPYAWQTFVGNSDGQGAVDACTGGLTYTQEISGALGRSYYAIHNHCHGLPILSLHNGDKVLIKDVGVFVVVDSRNVQQGDTTAAIRSVGGQILLQTCYTTGSTMRVVGLNRV